MTVTPESEPIPEYSFEELINKSVETLDKSSGYVGFPDALAITGVGYAILAYATAIREQKTTPPEGLGTGTE